MSDKKHSLHSGDTSALDEDLLDDDVFADDEGDDDVEDDDDDIFLSENSYTSDVEDDNPFGSVCDMPEDEAARYRKKA